MITITIKGIPKTVHSELKQRAETHGRSLNTEVLSVLASSVHSAPAEAEGVIHRARQFRNSLKFRVTARDLKRFKEAGRA